MMKPTATPMILHTDIGTDIDDAWALLQILKMPELNLLMTLTDTDHTVYRAALTAKLLEAWGHPEVEVGAGMTAYPMKDNFCQKEWLGDYNPVNYSGKYHWNGIGRMIELIRNHPGPLTLVSIGPTPSLAEALRLAPDIAAKVDFVGMFGSVRVGYNGAPDPVAEYNVAAAAKACQTVFSAPWRSMTITPLDSCGTVVLTGELYQKLRTSASPDLKVLMENYRLWKPFWVDFDNNVEPDKSSVLFDTVAVHLAISTEFLQMETLPIAVDDRGFTVIDEKHGQRMNVAAGWTDLDGYHRCLTEVLLR